MAPQVWFITGASSGFGRAITELVLANGDIAVATLRKPEALTDLAAAHGLDRLLVLKLDVAVQADITAAFARTIDAFGHIDVVYNNAAAGLLGEFEGISDEVARRTFDVNFWGAVDVTREALRVFREVNKPAGGRLLQVSSMAGFEANATLGFYSASKFAFEAISESLSHELDPAWNIKVTIIRPGGFRTKGVENTPIIPLHPAYTNPDLPSSLFRNVIVKGRLPGDPVKAVKAIYKLAALEDPPVSLTLGKDAIAAVRRKIASTVADTDKYESWSANLE